MDAPSLSIAVHHFGRPITGRFLATGEFRSSGTLEPIMWHHHLSPDITAKLVSDLELLLPLSSNTTSLPNTLMCGNVPWQQEPTTLLPCCGSTNLLFLPPVLLHTYSTCKPSTNAFITTMPNTFSSLVFSTQWLMMRLVPPTFRMLPCFLILTLTTRRIYPSAC
jgi:hypothetical protein